MPVVSKTTLTGPQGDDQASTLLNGRSAATTDANGVAWVTSEWCAQESPCFAAFKERARPNLMNSDPEHKWAPKLSRPYHSCMLHLPFQHRRAAAYVAAVTMEGNDLLTGSDMQRECRPVD